MRAYLAEIGRVPLLSPAEEVAVAKRIVTGTEAAEQLDHRGQQSQRVERRQGRQPG